MSSTWIRRQFTAPREDRAVLCRPSVADGSVTDLIAANRAIFAAGRDTQLCGESLAEVRRRCREEVLAAARDYTEELRGVPVEAADPAAPLVVSGHQPELYHPGVWLKNFAASKLATASGGTALNLIVDADLCDEQSIDVPSGGRETPRRRAVDLDQPDRQSPWEDLRIKSPEVLPAAGPQIGEAMRSWGIEPIAGEFWFDPVEVNGGDCLVQHLTRLRHNRQQAWDAPLLELPMRRLCRLPSFALFVCHVLRNIDGLQAAYNGGLATYRELNKLRSPSHPMPSLDRVEVDGRLRYEAPLWVWRAGDGQRRPLWIEQLGCSFRLYDVRSGDHAAAECVGVIRRTDCAADAWHRLLVDLDQQGVRVRPRALMTTLFARLCLSDLFVHGIGGAKYDEVTDHLFREFIGCDAPTFLTVSGTLKLPLPRYDVTSGDESRLRSLLWDLQHNADRHGAGSPELIARKQTLIAEQQASSASGQQDSRANLRRFRELKAVARELAEAAADQRSRVESELADVRRRQSANRLLGSREFSWVLYPEALLRDWLHEASDQIVGRTVSRTVAVG